MPSLLVLIAAVSAAVSVLLLVPGAARPQKSGPRRAPGSGTRWLKRSRNPAAGQTQAADLLDLTAALLRAGIGVEAGLLRLAEAVPGAERLAGVHRSLAAGASWEQAVELVADDPELRAYCEHLSFTYATGAPSARMLQASAARARAERRHSADAAAEKLGVSMMLPLGACFLPAFVLLGVVPVVVSMLPDALGF